MKIKVCINIPEHALGNKNSGYHTVECLWLNNIGTQKHQTKIDYFVGIQCLIGQIAAVTLSLLVN